MVRRKQTTEIAIYNMLTAKIAENRVDIGESANPAVNL